MQMICLLLNSIKSEQNNIIYMFVCLFVFGENIFDFKNGFFFSTHSDAYTHVLQTLYGIGHQMSELVS